GVLIIKRPVASADRRGEEMNQVVESFLLDGHRFTVQPAVVQNPYEELISRYRVFYNRHIRRQRLLYKAPIQRLYVLGQAHHDGTLRPAAGRNRSMLQLDFLAIEQIEKGPGPDLFRKIKSRVLIVKACEL